MSFLSAIPKDLLNRAKISDPIRKKLSFTENFTIQLNESTQLVLNKAKTCDFDTPLNVKTHRTESTGPRRWNENLSMQLLEKSNYPPQKSMRRHQVKRVSV